MGPSWQSDHIDVIRADLVNVMAHGCGKFETYIIIVVTIEINRTNQNCSKNKEQKSSQEPCSWILMDSEVGYIEHILYSDLS